VFDRKAVSRERVIGISFADILIQAVFVLFIAMLIGYIDPDELDKIKEYQQAGLDACQKLNKDSPAECRQFVKDHRIGPTESPENTTYANAGAYACELVDKKDPAECREAIAQRLGSLIPCLRSNSTVRPPSSTQWNILSPNTIEFKGFTPEYLGYLQAQKDTDRLIKVEKIVPGTVFTPPDIESNFGFVKESACFHESSAVWSASASSNELSKAFNAIYQLKKLKKLDR
jgi:hypothetical protein